MTAATLPRQRTQQAQCCYCDQRVPGLLASCNQPACVVAEVRDIADDKRRYNDD